MQVALSILKRINAYNLSTEDETLRFQVRIGIGANTDVLVADINNRQNVAGARISMASRIMNLADGNQILVGQSVYNKLQQREEYASAFKRFDATVKHHTPIAVYQFVDERHEGLNVHVPQHLIPSSPRPEQRHSIFKAQPPRRSDVISGRWVGRVDQKVGPGGPINFEITFGLSIDGITVAGQAFFQWKGSKILLQIAEGGFIVELIDMGPFFFLQSCPARAGSSPSTAGGGVPGTSGRSRYWFGGFRGRSLRGWDGSSIANGQASTTGEQEGLLFP